MLDTDLYLKIKRCYHTHDGLAAFFKEVARKEESRESGLCRLKLNDAFIVMNKKKSRKIRLCRVAIKREAGEGIFRSLQSKNLFKLFSVEI